VSLVELGRFYTPIQAELARLRLEAAGIDSVVFDAATTYVNAATGVRLMVDEDDEARARRVLSE
jgi:putative signal transducing protein